MRPGHEAEIVNASVRGAENAIRAAADARVGKVVLTSSTVTLPLRERGAPPVDESHWTDDLRIPYFRAKVEGERVAWRVARELGVDLVTILPGGITGPGFARNTPTIDLIEAMMLGLMRLGVPDYAYPIVDVRDVAAAHLLAAQQDCSGRFIACNDQVPTFREMIETMHAIDPRVPLPLMTMPDWFGPILPLFDLVNSWLLRAPRTATPESIGTLSGRAWNPSNRRIRELLGWRQSVSMEQSLRETMDAIRALRGR